MLDDYQIASFDGVRDAMNNGWRKVKMVLPTGSGKSHIALEFVKRALAKNKRVGFFVDRIVLADQFAKMCLNAGVEDFSIMQADNPLYRPYCPFQIISAQTLARRDIQELDLCIYDESHIIYKTLVDRMKAWEKSYWIGLTATPYTRGLGKIWDGMVSKIKMHELIEQGYLADFEFYSKSQTGFDVTGIPVVNGEYEEKALGQRASETGKKRVGNILDHWFEYANGLKTIMRCVDVPDSEFMAKEFKDAGVKADFIHSYLDPDQIKRKLNLFRENEITVMLQVAMFTRGFDMPDCMALIDGKPNKSLNDWIQFIGRGARGGWRRNGKEKCIVFDHALNCKRHRTFPHWVEPDGLDMGGRKKDKEPYKKKEKKVAECSKCGLAFEWVEGNFKCPNCGRAPQRQPLIDVVDDYLIKMKSDIKERHKVTPLEEKLGLYARLRAGANHLGFKDGWAAHKYKELFGVWPKEKVAPDVNFSEFLSKQASERARKIVFSLTQK